jgi:hypothetical protein
MIKLGKDRQKAKTPEASPETASEDTSESVEAVEGETSVLGVEVAFLGDVGKNVTLEQHIVALEEHRWQLQHRINVLEEMVADNARILNETRNEVSGMSRSVHSLFRSAFGSIGGGFQRFQVDPRTSKEVAIPKRIAAKFGAAELARRGKEKPESLQGLGKSNARPPEVPKR